MGGAGVPGWAVLASLGWSSRFYQNSVLFHSWGARVVQVQSSTLTAQGVVMLGILS